MERLGRTSRITLVFGLALVGLLLLVSTATARDYEAKIAEAQSRAEAASTEVVDLRTSVAPDRSRLAAAEKRAAPTRQRAQGTAAHVTATKHELHARRLHAAGTAAQIQDEQKKAAEKHDQSVHADIGFALAALIMAAIALSWSWFRASAPVAYLTRNPLKKVALAAAGIWLFALIVGGSMVQGGGLLAVIGGLAIGLSFGLPIAFLLARHSAEVQRGRAKAAFRRERLSPRVTQTIAGVFGVVFLVAVILGLTTGEAHSRSVSEGLRGQMKLAAATSPQVQSGERQMAILRKELAPLQKTVAERRSSLRAAQLKLHHAQARLTDAKNDERRWSHELVAAEAKEQRELEREEARERRREEKEEREYEHAVEREEREAAREAEAAEEAEACDPNYEGECLHDGIGDYDCAGGSGNGPNYVYSPVTVVGVDVFGLDENNNGIGCEDE